MALTPSLLERLKADFPQLTFVESEQGFSWSPEDQTVFFATDDPLVDALLLHEVAHSALEHHHYSRDIELLGMETDAWEHATTLAATYGTDLTDDDVQSHLDTYRDWLHERSRCPGCTATGHQIGPKRYRCLACSGEWRVNDAKVCALRRYSLST